MTVQGVCLWYLYMYLHMRGCNGISVIYKLTSSRREGICHRNEWVATIVRFVSHKSWYLPITLGTQQKTWTDTEECMKYIYTLQDTFNMVKAMCSHAIHHTHCSDMLRDVWCSSRHLPPGEEVSCDNMHVFATGTANCKHIHVSSNWTCNDIHHTVQV